MQYILLYENCNNLKLPFDEFLKANAMIADLFNTGDPFELAALDELDELKVLTRALTLAEGFALFLVSCNQPYQRQQLIDKLKCYEPQMTIQHIEFDEPIHHLLHALPPRLMEPRPDAVFVSGLEHSLPTVPDAHSSIFVANLNATRDSFSGLLHCPLVLWIPEYVLLAIWRGAPDFFSVCSEYYYFVSAQNEMTILSHVTTLNEIREINNLLVDEKWERIKSVKALLSNYYSLPSKQRDYQTENRLSIQLAQVYYKLGDCQSALETNNQALLLSRQIFDRDSEAYVLTNLATIYLTLRKNNKALKYYNQALTIYRESYNRKEEAYILENLGVVYLSLGRLDEAIEYHWIYKVSVEIVTEKLERWAIWA
ncbi:MAG: hypothetical protein ETSY2_08915, partial [Candidatus Entotheonella gemina]